MTHLIHSVTGHLVNGSAGHLVRERDVISVEISGYIEKSFLDGFPAAWWRYGDAEFELAWDSVKGCYLYNDGLFSIRVVDDGGWQCLIYLSDEANADWDATEHGLLSRWGSTSQLGSYTYVETVNVVFYFWEFDEYDDTISAVSVT
jgi:hypothetical protein